MAMKRKSVIVWAVVSTALLFGVWAGCTAEQLGIADRIVADANQAAQGAAQIAEGPAGGLIPVEVRAILELLGIGGALAVAIWQKVRASGVLEKNADLSVTLKAIVDAVEKLEPQAGGLAKAQIKQVMQAREIYATANPIVDSLKSKG